MKKRLAAMAMGMIMCIGFAAQNVDAASSCPHNNTGVFGDFESPHYWNTTHNVYRNQYVNGQQVYDVCTIFNEEVLCRVHCYDCRSIIDEYKVLYQYHSLANDPDHK